MTDSPMPREQTAPTPAPPYSPSPQPFPAPPAGRPGTAGSAAAPLALPGGTRRSLMPVALVMLAAAALVVLLRVIVALIDMFGVSTIIEQTLTGHTSPLETLQKIVSGCAWLVGIALLVGSHVLRRLTHNVLRMGALVMSVSLVLMFIATRLVNTVATSTIDRATDVEQIITQARILGVVELLAALVLGAALLTGAILTVRDARRLARTAL